MTPVPLRFIVEGVHDEHVIGHLLHKNGLKALDFDFRPKEDRNRNKDYLLQNLPNLLDPAEERPVSKFAIVLDAEDGVQSRWRGIRKAINLQLPDEPSPNGTIIAPNVGIWLMPDNIKAGSIEEFFAALIPPDDLLWQHAHEIVPAVPDGPRRFLPKQSGKALVNSWLAWRDPPALPMGKSIKQSTMRHDAELALRFVGWVKRLLAE